MTVFEDLIEELKDDNLLENTAVHQKQVDAASGSVDSGTFDAGFDGHGFDAENSIPPPSGDGDDLLGLDIPQIDEALDERDFFRKRAMDEVSSLQMVEHVLSAVEREHMKISPVPFDDLEAKKALHRFMQVSGDLKSAEHAESEFALRQETEDWSFALFERDRKISVANIRRFCEESRPVLSSAALISLARFYRNSPFSEDVRGKFDFVMTRLFSRDSEDETRLLLFPRREMVGHIATLYANWSSVAMYSQPEDSVDVSDTVKRFDEFGIEIETAASFDEVAEADFFNKVRIYKEESAEMFYVPEVTAAAIECNLRIGNRYVDLIVRERVNQDASTIEEKYGYSYDQIVSNAAGKTLLLVELLKLTPETIDSTEKESIQAFREEATPIVRTHSQSKTRSSSEFFGVKKWLWAVAAVSILISGGFYLWAEKIVGQDAVASVAKPLEIDDPVVNQHLRGLSTANETLFGVTQPSFEALDKEQQKEFLQKVLKLANERGLRKVNLLNNKGRTVAFASKDRLELTAQ